VTCPLVPLAASPCPSAIGCASGECRAGLAGGRACNGRRVYLKFGAYDLLFI